MASSIPRPAMARQLKNPAHKIEALDGDWPR